MRSGARPIRARLLGVLLSPESTRLVEPGWNGFLPTGVRRLRRSSIAPVRVWRARVCGDGLQTRSARPLVTGGPPIAAIVDAPLTSAPALGSTARSTGA